MIIKLFNSTNSTAYSMIWKLEKKLSNVHQSNLNNRLDLPSKNTSKKRSSPLQLPPFFDLLLRLTVTGWHFLIFRGHRVERFRERVRRRRRPRSDHRRRGRFQGRFRLRAQVLAAGGAETVASDRPSGSGATEGGRGAEDEYQQQQQDVQRGQWREQTENIIVPCVDNVSRAHSGDVVRWLPHRVAVIMWLMDEGRCKTM